MSLVREKAWNQHQKNGFTISAVYNHHLYGGSNFRQGGVLFVEGQSQVLSVYLAVKEKNYAEQGKHMMPQLRR